MQKTIRLDSDKYILNDSGDVEVCKTSITSPTYDDPTDIWGEYTFEWKKTKYQVGQQAVLVSGTDVSPNAIRNGRCSPQFYLSFDLGGVPGNSNRNIKRVMGWRGTTNDVSVEAHGIVTIRKIRRLKNGDIAVTVS